MKGCPDERARPPGLLWLGLALIAIMAFVGAGFTIAHIVAALT
jgi:hypothetical protein